ncbi:hypothetical protein PHLCEN_2v8001 [Hermanssonia centrifuga]|uniref:Uncharacterized protein n=1 Tax=Hermanssonia centrifuga TaxID=98765 RepID=A0A2R6NUX6_9APHY|nr:hypothetical protein PHLCEN_2v8001 [Hermanssonia centrifuga]
MKADSNLRGPLANGRRRVHEEPPRPVLNPQDIVVPAAQPTAVTVIVPAARPAAVPVVAPAAQPAAIPLVVRRRGPATGDVPLPAIRNSMAIWKVRVVPSYIHFVATLTNPWDADSTEEEIDALQQSWAAWFPQHNVLVTPGSAIYKVAVQRLYEWRSGIGKKGVVAVEWFWKERGIDTVQARCKYVATHLQPGFLCMYRDDMVERAFLLYQTGKIQSEQEQKDDIQAAMLEGDTELAKELKALHVRLRTFSESSWGKPTQEYVQAITRLSSKRWEWIIKEGLKYCVKHSKALLQIRAMGEQDDHALMIVDNNNNSGNSD